MVIPVCRLDMTVKKTRRTFSREVTPNVVSKERKLTVITETGVPERSCAKCHFVRPIYSGCSLCASVLCFVCYKNQCKTDTSKFKDTDANVHCLNCDKGISVFLNIFV